MISSKRVFYKIDVNNSRSMDSTMNVYFVGRAITSRSILLNVEFGFLSLGQYNLICLGNIEVSYQKIRYKYFRLVVF